MLGKLVTGFHRILFNRVIPLTNLDLTFAVLEPHCHLLTLNFPLGVVYYDRTGIMAHRLYSQEAKV